MLSMLGAAGAVALSLLTAPATAATGAGSTATVTTTDGIVVTATTAGGTGCPRGSVTVTTSPDGTVRMGFSDAYTASGSGSFRRNCGLSLTATSPAGTQVTVDGAEFTGTASLPAGASVSQLASYSYAGDPSQVNLQHDLAGPASGAWSSVDSSADLASLAAGACGASNILSVNTSVWTSRGTAATISVKAATIHLSTIRC